MPAAQKTTSSISFTSELFKLGSWTILLLPKEASSKLPSRGQVMVEGSLNGASFKSPLEPDGRLSHWLRVPSGLLNTAGADAGDTVDVCVRSIKEWPEPDVPADVQKALDSHKEAGELWQRITPMARWEWIRWIRSTGKDETRKKRVEVACSKMKAGERRPCCWNRNLCTEPSVSKGGVLLDPVQ